MKKALTALPFLLALGFSFYWVQKKPPISLQVHEQIQNQFREKIKKHILEQEGESITNLNVDKVWTKALSKKSIQVDFEYSFEEGKLGATKHLKGFALLKKEILNDEQNWILNEFQILEQSISLKETLRISLEEESSFSDTGEIQSSQ